MRYLLLLSLLLTCGAAISCTTAPSGPPNVYNAYIEDGLRSGCGGYLLVNKSGYPIDAIDRQNINEAKDACAKRSDMPCLRLYIKETKYKNDFMCREP